MIPYLLEEGNCQQKHLSEAQRQAVGAARGAKSPGAGEMGALFGT